MGWKCREGFARQLTSFIASDCGLVRTNQLVKGQTSSRSLNTCDRTTVGDFIELLGVYTFVMFHFNNISLVETNCLAREFLLVFWTLPHPLVPSYTK